MAPWTGRPGRDGDGDGPGGADGAVADGRRPGRLRGAALIESTLERMIALFDVEPLDPALTRFAGDSDGGWIRYHHESSYVGAGMSYVRGQVLTQDGRLVASFTQDAMIRTFAPNGSATSVALESRL